MYPHKMEQQCAQTPTIESEVAAMENYYIKSSRQSLYSRRKRLSQTPGLNDRVDKECKAWICYYFQPRSARLLSTAASKVSRTASPTNILPPA